MVGPFKVYASEWLTGGAHLVILAIAVQAETAAAWPYALAAMAVVSFFAWVATYRRYRQIHDLPTSKVASAAQGYVELFGRSQLIAGTPILSKFLGLPCCWYRFHVERRDSENKWSYEASGVSNEDFLLVDGSGECVISPDGAEVLCSRKEVMTRDDYRYTEWLMLPGGVIYALGEFSTVTGAVTDFDEKRDVSELLTEWKKDRKRLLERFDLNHDGTIDLKEWELARLEAGKEVRKSYGENRASDGVNVLRQPKDGRLFLLADDLPDHIGKRFARWSWLHLIVFFVAGIASVLMFF